MTDEQIALDTLKSLGLVHLPGAKCEIVLSALAAARADQHAECVRLLREYGDTGDALHIAAKFLEQHKPND